MFLIGLEFVSHFWRFKAFCLFIGFTKLFFYLQMTPKSFRHDDLHKALILCEAAATLDIEQQQQQQRRQQQPPPAATTVVPSFGYNNNNCICRDCQALPLPAQGSAAMPEGCPRYHIWHNSPHYR
jgi:hypothetical protein